MHALDPPVTSLTQCSKETKQYTDARHSVLVILILTFTIFKGRLSWAIINTDFWECYAYVKGKDKNTKKGRRTFFIPDILIS